MKELDKKYVFHIPLYKFEDDDLIKLEIGDALDDFIAQLNCDGLYITKVRSFYKSRCFDELLVSLFVSGSEKPEEIFKVWFRTNNDILGQESFSYECGDRMFIFDL